MCFALFIFLHINKQELPIYYDNMESQAKNIVFDCVVRSEHCINS